MNEIISLNKKDIKKIIADYYNIKEEKVFVSIYNETKGSGFDEHKEPFVLVNVVKEV